MLFFVPLMTSICLSYPAKYNIEKIMSSSIQDSQDRARPRFLDCLPGGGGHADDSLPAPTASQDEKIKAPGHSARCHRRGQVNKMRQKKALSKLIAMGRTWPSLTWPLRTGSPPVKGLLGLQQAALAPTLTWRSWSLTPVWTQ
jgi:hypothetical protein